MKPAQLGAPVDDTVPLLARSCPVCGSNRVKLHLDGSRHSLDHAAFGSSRTDLSIGRLLRCIDCGFGFTEVRPALDRLKDLYRSLDTAVYESEALARTRTAQRHLRMLNRHAHAPGRLLDVGCASGKFLFAATEAGWTATGIEPSEVLCRQAQQLLDGSACVLNHTLEESDLPAAHFDAVTMWDVLEHVPDPRAFISKSISLLKPGGLLVVNVPDLNSCVARLLGRRWPLLLPEHLNYFTRASLKACVQTVGAELLEIGHRPVNFSIQYVLYRASQHMPVFRLLSHAVAGSRLSGCLVLVWMGELYGVWRKRNAI
ncbi:MAG TPA: class I SAM-dependent methyltransferase [Bryobacteraceae bacterium]